MLRIDDYHKSLLITEMYRGGLEYGGHLAACLIGNCIANRARLGWGAWTDIIANLNKYSAEDLPNRDFFPNIWEPNFQRLLSEVENIYDGSGKDISNGALYWCNLSRVTRPWFLEEIIRSGNYEACSNMNSLTVYRPIQRLGTIEHRKIYGRE